jgi:hypothetical protein
MKNDIVRGGGLMEAAGSSEASVTNHRSILCHIPAYYNPDLHHQNISDLMS